MFKDKLKIMIENIKNKEEGKEEKKKIENLVFFVILLIITIVIINYVWNGDKNTNKETTKIAGKELASTNTNNPKNKNEEINQEETTSTEQRLESILQNINGVGEVKVFINYSESSETVAMYNENTKTSITEETDQTGGKRKVESTDAQKEIVYQDDNGNKTPIIQKTLKPKIEGVIITAKGAANAETKTKIIQAVEAVTGLGTHKIQVFEKAK